MKKCPYCAEEVQDEAIKCRFCNEMIADKEQLPWFFRTGVIVMAFLTVGPLALPLVWMHPKYSLKMKIAISLITAAASLLMGIACYNSIKSITRYYQTIFQM